MKTLNSLFILSVCYSGYQQLSDKLSAIIFFKEKKHKALLFCDL